MRLTKSLNLSALVTCHTLYVVFDLAECCVFVKQSVDPVTETLLRGHPLFQSYGVRLPSSLTRFHSYAFALLRDPTCVGLRYGRPGEQQAAFLGRLSGDTLCPKARLSIRLPSHFSPCAFPTLNQAGAGILICCASTTPYGLALAPD